MLISQFNTIALGRLLVLFVALFLSTDAFGTTLVVPSGFENTDGSSATSFPFREPMRHQTLYDAANFSGLVGPITLNQVRFRSDFDIGVAFSQLVEFQVNLSTSSTVPDNMDLTFANNVGGDDTVVYTRKTTTLSTANNASSNGVTKEFDIVVPFDTGFTYDPSAGNLLVDLRIFGTGSPGFALDQNGTFTDGASRVVGLGVNSAQGTNNYSEQGVVPFALVMQFEGTVVPEPSAGLLLIVVSLSSIIVRRRS